MKTLVSLIKAALQQNMAFKVGVQANTRWETTHSVLPVTEARCVTLNKSPELEMTQTMTRGFVQP